MTEIAHYKRWRMFRRVFAATVFLLLLDTYLYIRLFTLGASYLFHERPFYALLYLIAWIGGPIVLWMFLIVFVRLLFQGGRALWIENGKVILLHRWNVAMKCGDVINVTAGTYGRRSRPAVLITSADGQTEAIPTTPLVETSDEIIARLKASLNLHS